MKENKRKARKATALLSKNGYLRISSDMIPDEQRKKKFWVALTPLPREKQLLLKILKNRASGGKYLAIRKAMYSNEDSLCPLIAACSAIRYVGVELPKKKSREYKVRRRGKGNLRVQF